MVRIYNEEEEALDIYGHVSITILCYNQAFLKKIPHPCCSKKSGAFLP